ncbi:hypothetical protein ACPV5O_24930 [Vibrio maritimus]|uniref:hypothetical protein n=1 Tax=Vibrio maritimus TaxID=990268 RepID=UPI0040694111
MSFYENKRSRNRNKEASNQAITREFVMRDGSKLPAKRVVVPHAELKSRVAVHPLNPRYQQALSEEALADILPTISTTGVNHEGVAETVDGKYLVLDSSRRLAAAEIGGADLPLWVFDESANLSRADAEYIAEIARLHRALSYREQGLPLVKAIKDDEKLEHFPALLEKFRFKPSQERTVRRYISAAVLPQELIDLFPDSEGIDSKYYDKLKSVCKAVGREHKETQGKTEHDVTFFERLTPTLLDWIKTVQVTVDASLSTQEKQASILKQLTGLSSVEKPSVQPTWSKPERVFEKSKHTYAEVIRHKNGKEVQIKCRQLNAEQEAKLMELLASFN